jgi:hypothetical protein
MQPIYPLAKAVQAHGAKLQPTSWGNLEKKHRYLLPGRADGRPDVGRSSLACAAVDAELDNSMAALSPESSSEKNSRWFKYIGFGRYRIEMWIGTFAGKPPCFVSIDRTRTATSAVVRGTPNIHTHSIARDLCVNVVLDHCSLPPAGTEGQ